jgi:hypothetical protein
MLHHRIEIEFDNDLNPDVMLAMFKGMAQTLAGMIQLDKLTVEIESRGAFSEKAKHQAIYSDSDDPKWDDSDPTANY